MSCRRLPQCHFDRGWILGVALTGMLAQIRSALRGFTCVRYCSVPPASSPHAFAGSCSCLWLTVPSNRFCKELAPSIDHSCSTYPLWLARRAFAPFRGSQTPQRKEQHQENSHSSLFSSFSPYCSLIKKTKPVSEMSARKAPVPRSEYFFANNPVPFCSIRPADFSF